MGYATSAELGIDRSFVTERDGTYRVSALPSGIYESKARRMGLLKLTAHLSVPSLHSRSQGVDGD